MSDPYRSSGRRVFSACEKCGEPEPTVKYYARDKDGRGIPLYYTKPRDKPHAEYFHVTCTRCGYDWTEAVARV